MRITIILALTLAAVYVAQAEPLYKEEAQGHPLEQDHKQGHSFQELAHQGRLKRATCVVSECSRFCATKRRMGLCNTGRCQCY